MNQLEGTIRRERNLSHVETGNGSYTLLLASHLSKVKPESLPQKPDGVIFETGTVENYVKNPLKTFGELEQIFTHKEYVAQLGRRKIPIFFGDLYSPKTGTLTIIDLLTDLGLTGIAGGALFHVYQDPQLIRGALEIAVASWIFTPMVGTTIRAYAGLFSMGVEKATGLLKFTNKVHPERAIVLVRARNAVLAEKSVYLNEQAGGDQHYIIGAGFDHVELEDELRKTSESRVEYLHKTQWYWGRFISPESLYTIKRFDYRKRKWRVTQTLEVPQLRELITAR